MWLKVKTFSVNNYRYILEPYKGMKTRHNCPRCNKPHKYTRYIDQQTGKHLPYRYGKCERLNNCAYELNPYKDGYSKNQWYLEKQEAIKTANYQIQPMPSHSILNAEFIPFELFKSSLNHYHQNTFIKYLKHLFGPVNTRKLIDSSWFGALFIGLMVQ